FLKQQADGEFPRIGHGRPKERNVNLFILQPLDEVVREALFQRQRHQREVSPERPNDTWRERMKRARRSYTDADSALLASRCAPSRFECVIEVSEHDASVFQEGAACIGQLNAAWPAPK